MTRSSASARHWRAIRPVSLIYAGMLGIERVHQGRRFCRVADALRLESNIKLQLARRIVTESRTSGLTTLSIQKSSPSLGRKDCPLSALLQ